MPSQHGLGGGGGAKCYICVCFRLCTLFIMWVRENKFLENISDSQHTENNISALPLPPPLRFWSGYVVHWGFCLALLFDKVLKYGYSLLMTHYALLMTV